MEIVIAGRISWCAGVPSQQVRSDAVVAAKIAEETSW